MEHRSLDPQMLQGPVMLVVGRIGGLIHNADLLGPRLVGVARPDLHFCEYDELGQQVLDDIRPAVVVSLLLGPEFDAVDVARRLHELGYNGSYRALTSGLPNGDIVKREVAAEAPGLDFQLLNIERPRQKR